MCGFLSPDMQSLRVFMTLLCCALLCPVDAMPYPEQTSVSKMHLPSVLESQLPSSDPLPCRALLPKSLPGFTHLFPLSKFLIGLALRSALEAAGCQTDAVVLQIQLYRLGGVKATQALTHYLQRLQKGRNPHLRVSEEALVSALQFLAREQPGPKRAQRSLSSVHCENEREQGVHNIVQLLPAVGAYYNLGTALYYAIQNCSDKAKQRGQDGAIDLGYDLLMTMAGLSGGPTGVAISAALKPAFKVGVLQLIRYYYDEKEANTSQPETRKDGLWVIPDVSDMEEKTTRVPMVPEAANSTSYWGWILLRSYG
uniref:apolipoprotein F n=1 Tax=Jaculus jaculus TaxID=51337 RepID=UPI001E1B21E2|nr:apolipoprotein F [Jaculus jaculus]